MSTMTAALGISQIAKTEKIIKMRQKNAHYFSKNFSGVSEIFLPEQPKGYRHIFQMYTIKLKDKKTRDALKDYLGKKQISSRVYFYCIHLTDFYKKSFGCKKGHLPVTEKISDCALTLPMYPSLSKKEMDYIIACIKNFFK